MSFFRRHPHQDDLEHDDEDGIDPELRLRTVRTAASTLAETARQEERSERRRLSVKGKAFFHRMSQKKKTRESATSQADAPEVPTPPVAGVRRKIYVNSPLPREELDHRGEPVVRYKRNKVRTSSEYGHVCVPLPVR